MTFDEIQKTIEGMLAVQRNLQESQLKLVEKQANHDENFTRIEDKFTQLQDVIGELAQIALASDKALLERIETIEERVFPEQN